MVLYEIGHLDMTWCLLSQRKTVMKILTLGVQHHWFLGSYCWSLLPN